MVPDRTVQNHRSRCGSVDAEEQRAWVAFYKRVGRDADLAAEVMAQLAGDAEMKRHHLALYLSCKQALRVHRARQARDKRIAQWLRLLVQLTLMRPVAFVGNAAQRAFHRSADVLAEAVIAGQQSTSAPSNRGSGSRSGTSIEPTAARIRSLMGDAEFADGHARLQQQAGMCPVASPEHGSGPRDESPAPVAQVGRR
jgi:hypothetical protein